MNVNDVLEQINSGAFDSDLSRFSKEVETRLAEVRKTRVNDDYMVGDKVRFNNYCGTRYLVGETATVVGHKKVKLIVKLDNPQGRFARESGSGLVSANITVPVGIVDPA